MERLLELLNSLSGPQIDALAHVATAMLYAQPQGEDEYLTVRQIHEQYGRPASSVYSAMSSGRLQFVTPEGQSKPMYARREDVELWLGRRRAATS